jgi:hypothetical protein
MKFEVCQERFVLFRVDVVKLEVCQECFVFLSRVYVMTFEEGRVYVMKFEVCQQGFVLFSSVDVLKLGVCQE